MPANANGVLLFFLLTVTSSAFAAESDRVVLTEGLPSFPPLKRAHETGRHAAISDTITFVWGDRTAERAESFWLWIRGESSSTLTQVPLVPGDGGWVAQLRVPGDRERLLHLGLDRESGVLRYRWSRSASTIIEEGQTLPAVDLARLDGSSFRLDTLRGKWVVLNWWAVTCLPCREEIPQLNRLTRELSGEDITFVAVAPDDAALIRRFLEKYPFDYVQARGDLALTSVLGEEFPRHLIIAPDGVVARSITGGSPDIGEKLAKEIERLRGAEEQSQR